MSGTIPRYVRLAALIAVSADSQGVCPRWVLREMYAANGTKPIPESRGKSDPQRSTLADDDRYMRHRSNRGLNVKSAMRGTRWYGDETPRGSSKGRQSSKRLSEDLRLLEDVGAIVREGPERVRISDASALRRIVADAVPQRTN